ncbi:hypothetical protein R6Z07M_004842 [Ovis aries]
MLWRSSHDDQKLLQELQNLKAELKLGEWVQDPTQSALEEVAHKQSTSFTKGRLSAKYLQGAEVFLSLNGQRSYLEDSSLEKESSKIQRLADTYGKLKRTNSVSKEKKTSLVKEVKKEKSRPSRQKKMMAEIIRMIQLPENGLGEEVFRLQEGFSNTMMAGSLHPYCLSLRV